MASRTLEGTWEEIQAQANELKGHRLRVTILDAETNGQEEIPLDRLLSDRVGILDLGTAPAARDVKEVFGDIVTEKLNRRRTDGDSV